MNKKLLPLFTLLASVMVLSVSGVSCQREATELNVFAAAGAKAATDAACLKYTEESGVTVNVTYGGGGEVLSQMMLDKSGDVYIAPEQSFMEKAITEGVVLADTVKTVAYMIPVIAVKAGNPKNINSLADLASPGIQVAITRPDTTLVGQFAIEIFEKAGLADAIGANIVTQAANPNNLLTILIMGQVDAIITWHYYEYLNPDDIQNIYLSPEQLTGVAEMRIAVSAYSENPKSAQKFVDFIASEEGKGCFADYSYIIDEEEVGQYWQ
jgi:molybdate transport system substrate-binding protein